MLSSCEDCTVQLGAVHCSILINFLWSRCDRHYIQRQFLFLPFIYFLLLFYSLSFIFYFLPQFPFFIFTSTHSALALFLCLYVYSPSAAPYLSRPLAVKPLSIPRPLTVSPGSLPRSRYESFSALRLSGSFNQILNDSFGSVVPIYCMRI